jgi:hypothetical protein
MKRAIQAVARIACTALLLNVLSAGTAMAQAAQAQRRQATQSITPDQLFGWAQTSFSSLFPGSPLSVTAAGFVYRYYPATQTFLAVLDGGDVYVLGPISGGTLLRVGALADFSCAVLANCGPTPWWPPPNINAEFAKVSNPKTLPLEGGQAPAVGGPVWQQATRDGTLQYFYTDMVVPLYGGKPVLGVFFTHPVTKQSCVNLVDRATGANLLPDAHSYTGCSADPFDWVAGRGLGYMTHLLSGVCNVNGWNEALQTWDAGRFTCPP